MRPNAAVKLCGRIAVMADQFHMSEDAFEGLVVL
jgi:hypothetical protein